MSKTISLLSKALETLTKNLEHNKNDKITKRSTIAPGRGLDRGPSSRALASQVRVSMARSAPHSKVSVMQTAEPFPTFGNGLKHVIQASAPKTVTSSLNFTVCVRLRIFACYHEALDYFPLRCAIAIRFGLSCFVVLFSLQYPANPYLAGFSRYSGLDVAAVPY